MIDLSKFTSETKACVPVRNNAFQYNRKKYVLNNISDGWYYVKMWGNSAVVLNDIVDLDTLENIKLVNGYVYNNQIVFQNFDVAKRNFNLEMMAPLHFNNAPSFTPIRAAYWEDKSLYFYDVRYSDFISYLVVAAIESGSDIKTIKGVTPELKTLSLFYLIEKQKLEEQLAKLRQETERKNFLSSLPGRLQSAFAAVGAVLINFTQQGKRIIVDWQLQQTKRKYNSVLDADSFKVVEAGYCMSGHDKEHSLTSMVLLAEDYEKRHVTVITRQNDSRTYRDDNNDYDYDNNDYDDDDY